MIELKNVDLTKDVRYKGTPLTITAAQLNAIPASTSSAAELNILTGVTATAAELNLVADVSVNTETIAKSTAVSVVKSYTKIDSTTGTGAITLAAPSAADLGLVKVIEMVVDNGDITLALTNVVGGSAATTCTFSAVDQALILVGGTNKWQVIAESGVALT